MLQLRVSKSGPGAPDCQPNRSTLLRRMRFVAGRGAVAELLLAGDAVTELLLAGALQRRAIGKLLLVGRAVAKSNREETRRLWKHRRL